MYSYVWDNRTRGYKLTTQTAKFVAHELRAVFAEELKLLGFNEHFTFEENELRPLMWAQQNFYIYKGEVVAKLVKGVLGRSMEREYLCKPCKLIPVDVEGMVAANRQILDALVADTLKRIKEMYDEHQSKCDISYIGFSGGKDSVLLLDLCHRVLPLSVPVVFSDTTMELPDTYAVWNEVKVRYPGRPFVKVQASSSALVSWQQFGPPSQVLRWCCSVHKSAPAILYLKSIANNPSARFLAYIGVRGDESIRRSSYDDVSDGLKSQNQINAMPILNWGTHELYLYTFSESLIMNRAYRLGLPRVGCVLCPMSSDRQVATIKALYPHIFSGFENLVRSSIVREFRSHEDSEEFVISGGWRARRSGVSLASVIAVPTFDIGNDQTTVDIGAVRTLDIYEWLKTLGTLQWLDGQSVLAVREGGSNKITVSFGDGDSTTRVVFDFRQCQSDKARMKWIRSVINKSVACVSCGVCEAECPVGAISFSPTIRIDEQKCIHCKRCHSVKEGCLRYYSKRYAGGSTMNISGINKYMTFGLKKEWISVLAQERTEFRSTTALGNRMVPSAITWFREAKLIQESTSIKPTRLLDVGEKFGFDRRMFWDLIWMGLVNVSPLMKWYVCNNTIGEKGTQDAIGDKLLASVASSSVRKGALQSLCSTLKDSPLGNDVSPVVLLENNGRRVVSLKRVAHSVEPLVILYSFYIMSQASGRSSFTISEMMTGDFDSSYVSPLAAFGMPVDEFQAQCAGLAEKYPAFLACSFTHGLDEIRIFPESKGLDDVIGLVLGE